MFLIVPARALMPREIESLRPPIFQKTISCLALIMGRDRLSKAQSGRTIDRGLSLFTASIIPGSNHDASDLESELIMGDFESVYSSYTGLASRVHNHNLGLFSDHRFCPGWIMGLFS